MARSDAFEFEVLLHWYNITYWFTSERYNYYCSRNTLRYKRYTPQEVFGSGGESMWGTGTTGGRTETGGGSVPLQGY